MFGDKRWEALAGSSTFNVDEWLRATHQPQAVLEGSGSLVRDDSEPEPLPLVAGDPTMLYEDYLPDVVVHRRDHRGWFVMVDGRGRMRNWIKEWPDEAWAGWHLLVLVGRHTPPEYLAHLQKDTIPYLVAGEGPVDLGLALAKLSSQLGVKRVYSSSGSRLGGALLRAGLVDEINVEFLPAVIGGFDTPALFDSPALKPDEWPIRLRLISAQVQPDGRVWLRYEVPKMSIGGRSHAPG
jgi:riboflavin biosynthesis pyrimidine reductase